jgi:hypothetical protein
VSRWQPALERQARTGSARRATVRSAEPEPGADEPGHDCRLTPGTLRLTIWLEPVE